MVGQQLVLDLRGCAAVASYNRGPDAEKEREKGR